MGTNTENSSMKETEVHFEPDDLVIKAVEGFYQDIYLVVVKNQYVKGLIVVSPLGHRILKGTPTNNRWYTSYKEFKEYFVGHDNYITEIPLTSSQYNLSYYGH